MSDVSDDFYIGYEERAPRGLVRFVRARVVLFCAAAAALAGAFAAFQERFAPSRFEFGVERSFEGRLEHLPYPVLAIERPGRDAGESRWLLTRFGKFDASNVTSELDGHRVRVSGQLIHRGTATMLEIDPATLEDLGAAYPPEPSPLAEPVTLTGEIVDAKCHLGVMKPGDLKPHRACAARCISGGVPAALVVRDSIGRATYYLLADEAGRPVGPALLDRIAEPIEVTGRVRAHGDLLVLHAAPEAFVRVD